MSDEPSITVDPGEAIDAYVVEGKLGEGGMGVVFKGHHRETHFRVAIKVLNSKSPEVAARFRREASQSWSWVGLPCARSNPDDIRRRGATWRQNLIPRTPREGLSNQRWALREHGSVSMLTDAPARNDGPMTVAPPDDDIGDVYRVVGSIVGKHRVKRVLGGGGMAVVYEGEHTVLADLRALKFCLVPGNRTLKDRLLSEAKAMARVQHPNVCRVLDVEWGPPDGTTPIIVMEFLRGRTFWEEIQTGPIPWRRAVEVAIDVLAALAAAHAAGVIHRDIKPENIFLAVQKDGSVVVKVMDFGISKVIGGIRTTRTNVSMGTPHYMSPEQITNAKDVDGSADVYSVGALLYRAIVGQFVFPRASAAEVQHAHLTERPPGLHDALRQFAPHFADSVPAQLGVVIARALAKSPASRYPDVMAMRDDLLRCLEAGDHALRAEPDAPTFAPPSEDPTPFERPGGASSASGVPEPIPTVDGRVQRHRSGPSSTERAALADRNMDEWLREPVKAALPPRRRLPLAWVGAIAVLLAALGVLLAWTLKRGEPAAPTAAPPENRANALPTHAGAPDAPTTGGHAASLTISTIPAGAMVADGTGRILGNTPLVMPGRVGESISIRLSLDGFVEQRHQLTFKAESSKAQFLLERTAAAPTMTKKTKRKKAAPGAEGGPVGFPGFGDQ
jgi:serine/threonine-protein kinase